MKFDNVQITKVNNGYVMMILGNVQNIFLTPNALISQNNKKAKVL